MPTVHDDDLLVVNGWLANSHVNHPGDVVFAGLHIAQHQQQLVQWCRQSTKIVGARDPYTERLLSNAGVSTEMIGCATLTLPRYDGKRAGAFSIDVTRVPGTVALSNKISNIDWKSQWQQASLRLKQIRSAECVYTNRLHVILPCLAFGTPVYCKSSDYISIIGRDRLSLLDTIGFRYDVFNTIDVSEWATHFREFLIEQLGLSLGTEGDPHMPHAVAPHMLDHDWLPHEPVLQANEHPRILYFSNDIYCSRFETDCELSNHVKILQSAGFDAGRIFESYNSHSARGPVAVRQDFVAYPYECLPYLQFFRGNKVVIHLGFLDLAKELQRYRYAFFQFFQHCNIKAIIADCEVSARIFAKALPGTLVCHVQSTNEGREVCAAEVTRRPMILVNSVHDTDPLVYTLFERGRAGLNRCHHFEYYRLSREDSCTLSSRDSTQSRIRPQEGDIVIFSGTHRETLSAIHSATISGSVVIAFDCVVAFQCSSCHSFFAHEFDRAIDYIESLTNDDAFPRSSENVSGVRKASQIGAGNSRLIEAWNQIVVL